MIQNSHSFLLSRFSYEALSLKGHSLSYLGLGSAISCVNAQQNCGSVIVLFFFWWLTQGGAADITMIASMVLRRSEKLRCAQKEKMVARKVFREEDEHSQAVLRRSSSLRNQVSWAERC